MKSKLSSGRSVLYLLAAAFVLTVRAGLFAQERQSTALKDFKIVVEKTETGIKMQSVKGSAWTVLGFSIKKDQPRAIDEYGIADLDKVSSKKDAGLADFLFTMTKTGNEIVLKGIEGTAWTDLSFSLAENGKQAVDQYGMTDFDTPDEK